MKKHVRFFVLIMAITMLLGTLGCGSSKVPSKYWVDDTNVGLPAQIKQGFYKLKDVSAIKYHAADQSVDKALYFQRISGSEFKLTDEEFCFGDNVIKSPYYREIQFNGIIRAFMNKEDRYRPIEASEAGNVDANESARDVKRCFVITKGDGSDTGYRLYMFDDEIWVAHFYENGDITTCEDIFVLTYDNFKNKNLD